MILSQDIFTFLKKLANNNSRDWFQANKESFKIHQSNIQIFGEEVKTRLNTFDSISNFKIFRIYRDVRFSKDKTPYKKHFGLTWKRTPPELRGGYYLHLSPGESFLACGVWDPSKNDLDRIRYEFIHDGNKFKELIQSKSINSIWSKLQGNELKTSPRGIDKNHLNIDLIRKKQYIFSKKYTDTGVCSGEFLDDIETSFKVIQPFLNYISEILTTNKNGESLF
tara:strand:- start:195 stop:863 length:669 start_codon:yes stop_codon:yes gene_type:complete